MAGDLFKDAVIFLGSAIVCVPLAKKLGIGSVLGYLLGGILIGPFVLGWVGQEGEDVMHTAEFGVVMMLFVIGLELSPAAFWRMRNMILGLGGLQMALTAIVLWPLLRGGLGLAWNTALGLALALAMSSTAIVLQTLKERNLEKTGAGQSAFAVLLFQDLAIIPLLALLPFLAGMEAPPTQLSPHPIIAFLQSNSTLTIIGTLILIILGSRYLIDPLLVLISRSQVRELFTATTLFIITGVAWVMNLIGISPALGAFMTGVLLANSAFRHELESNVEPFKGLLLGLFFTAVGSTINFTVIAENPWKIGLMVLSVMASKSIILLILGHQFRLSLTQNVLFALLLAQIGEFVFVLLAAMQRYNLLDQAQGDFLMASVTLSMIGSPLLLYLHEQYLAVRLNPNQANDADFSMEISEENAVIIAGFGHFGSTIGRFLRANQVEATILDNDSDRVELLRKMGFNVYYGDASRLDLLESAGAAKAKILILAMDAVEQIRPMANAIRRHFPHLKLFIRSKNRYDAYELIEDGHEQVYRESLHTSVFLAADVLAGLGHRRYTVQRKANDFIKYDTAAMLRLAKDRHNLPEYIIRVKEEIAQQEQLLREDSQFNNSAPDVAWDSSKRTND